MTEFFTGRSFGDFLFGFGALFAIINPYGMAFVFLDRTRQSVGERTRKHRLSRRHLCVFRADWFPCSSAARSCRFFGISMPALRIAGGLVVAATGWSMLHAAPLAAADHASSSANYTAIRGMAFFPLTIPLTTGPGSIATAIAISTSRPSDLDALFTPVDCVAHRCGRGVRDHLSRLREVQCDGPAFRRGRHRRDHAVVGFSAAVHRGADHDHRRSLRSVNPFSAVLANLLLRFLLPFRFLHNSPSGSFATSGYCGCIRVAEQGETPGGRRGYAGTWPPRAAGRAGRRLRAIGFPGLVVLCRKTPRLGARRSRRGAACCPGCPWHSAPALPSTLRPIMSRCLPAAAVVAIALCAAAFFMRRQKLFPLVVMLAAVAQALPSRHGRPRASPMACWRGRSIRRR